MPSTSDPSDSTDGFDLAEIAVVVLAAGTGRRLGLGPKAHVRLGDETFLSRVVRACRGAGLGKTWVVGSVEDRLIEGACAALGASLAVNIDPARGMSSSVHVGLAATFGSGVSGVLSGVMIFPVDVPLVRPATVRAIAEGLRAGNDVWARPVFEGAHGHPIAIGPGLIPKLMAMGDDVPLREALRQLGASAVDVSCLDRGVVADIDLPKDLEAWTSLP